MTLVIVTGGIDLSTGSLVALTTVDRREAAEGRLEPGRRGARRASPWRPRSGALIGPVRGALPADAVRRHARRDDRPARRREGPRVGAEDRLRPARPRSASSRPRSRRPGSGSRVALAIVVAARARLHALRAPRLRGRQQRGRRAALRHRPRAREDPRLRALEHARRHRGRDGVLDAHRRRSHRLGRASSSTSSPRSSSAARRWRAARGASSARSSARSS